MTLPERTAHAFVVSMDGDRRGHPLLMLLRAAASNESAAGEIYTEMLERYIVGQGTLATMDGAKLERHLAGIIRHVLGPVLPAPSGGTPPQG